MASRLVLPHSFRVAGVFFLLYLALGHLPALFARPAGLGDIAAGIAAPLVARKLAQGTGRRAAVWFNVYGLTDLATATTLGALTGYGLLHVTPSSTPISQLPLALVVIADVPLMIALHITCLVTLARASRPVPPATRPGLSAALAAATVVVAATRPDPSCVPARPGRLISGAFLTARRGAREVPAADSGQRRDACHERDDRRDQQDARNDMPLRLGSSCT
jgi:hypothetical protein